MDGQTGADVLMVTATCVVGGLLRLGVPLALTALLMWGLRRLDESWQWEAGRRPAPKPPARRPPAPSPTVTCWVINACPLERRLNCPAYAHPEIPCWQHFRDEQGHLREACLTCQVLRLSPAVSLQAA